MNRIAGEGSGLRRHGRGLGLLGGLAAVAAIAVLAVGPAGAQTSSTSSTSSSTSSTSSTVPTSTTAPTAVTQTATPAFNCFGADATTTTTLNTVLGPTGGLPKDAQGNYYIVSTFHTSASVPQFLENGQTFPVSFTADLDISATLGNALLPAGSTISVTGVPTFVISGGGSGGPFPGSPTTGSVTKGTGPQTLPTVTASGTVTGVDKTQPIIYSIQQPLLSNTTITVGGTAIPLNLTCSAADPDVAATNGTLPPEPPTTTAPPAAKAAATTANFTG